MPRLNKTDEMKIWLKGKSAHMVKIIFQWEPSNKTVCVLAESKESAEAIAKDANKSCDTVEYLGCINQVIS